MSIVNAVHHEVLIVGGGVAGLHTAFRLHQKGRSDIKVFESRQTVGGRVKTHRNDDKKPLYNDFAWRIGETNQKMLDLCKELKIDLFEQFTPKKLDHKGSQCDGGADEPHPDVHETPEGRAPLSTYASYCLASTKGADEMDRASGYAGRTAQISFPGETHGELNYAVVNGMSHIPDMIAAQLPEGVVNLNHRVKDVRRLEDGKYFLDVVYKEENSFLNKTFTCNTLVLAAPPVSMKDFTIAKDGLSTVFSAVHQRRLVHAYATSSSPHAPDTSDKEDRIYRGFPDSILQQVVSGDYGGGVFQAAYACDRFERVWRELAYQGSAVVKRELEKQLAKIDLPAVQGVSIDKVHLCAGFVHRWHIEAHVNGKNKEDLQAQAVYPQPERLPNLFLIGEAFSSQQGWTEGALLTSIAAIDHILNNPTKSNSKYAQPLPPPTKEQVAYRGLVADISKFADLHPGGDFIKFFGGQVIDEMFDNYHKGCAPPLATLFGLQSGVLEKKK